MKDHHVDDEVAFLNNVDPAYFSFDFRVHCYQTEAEILDALVELMRRQPNKIELLVAKGFLMKVLVKEDNRENYKGEKWNKRIFLFIYAKEL